MILDQTIAWLSTNALTANTCYGPESGYLIVELIVGMSIAVCITSHGEPDLTVWPELVGYKIGKSICSMIQINVMVSIFIRDLASLVENRRLLLQMGMFPS